MVPLMVGSSVQTSWLQILLLRLLFWCSWNQQFPTSLLLLLQPAMPVMCDDQSLCVHAFRWGHRCRWWIHQQWGWWQCGTWPCSSSDLPRTPDPCSDGTARDQDHCSCLGCQLQCFLEHRAVLIVLATFNLHQVSNDGVVLLACQ